MAARKKNPKKKSTFTGRTIVMGGKIKFLLKQCKRVSKLDGAVAEVGVYQGGSAMELSKALPEKQLHLFDTFKGMPKTNPKIDGHRKGDFGDTSLEDVKRLFQKRINVHIWPGLFPDSAEELTEDEFCLVHVDVDIYKSTKAVIEFFWPKLVSGGVMVFDDYNSIKCEGTNKAVDEFFAKIKVGKGATAHVVKP
jgi:O-methyltransferase